MIWPTTLVEPLVHVFTYSPESLGNALFYTNATGLVSGLGSATWQSANTALFIPFSLYKTITVQKMFVHNGTAVSGNLDIGIYSTDGTLLVSAGSTAQSGISVIQTISITPTQLAPGTYYFSLVFNNTTATTRRINISDTGNGKMLGLAQMASAFPLPANATFASSTFTQVPLFGLSTRNII